MESSELSIQTLASGICVTYTPSGINGKEVAPMYLSSQLPFRAAQLHSTYPGLSLVSEIIFLCLSGAPSHSLLPLPQGGEAEAEAELQTEPSSHACGCHGWLQASGPHRKHACGLCAEARMAKVKDRDCFK